MSGIGGLDVSYGARHQVVRTNVACVHTATTAISEARAAAAFDILSAGLGHTILKPDFIYFGTDSTTASYDAANIFQVDTTGNGAKDSTVMNKGPLLRDTRHVPFSVTSAPGPAENTLVALGTAVQDRTASGSTLATVPSGTLALEAILNVGLIEFTGDTAAASAFGSLTSATESDATEAPVADSDAEFAGSVYSAALAQAASGVENAADMGVAGVPEATVGTLNISGVVKNLMATAVTDSGTQALTTLNLASSTNVAAVLDNHIANGRASAGDSSTNPGNFETLMSADSDAFATSLGFASVVSICKVL